MSDFFPQVDGHGDRTYIKFININFNLPYTHTRRHTHIIHFRWRIQTHTHTHTHTHYMKQTFKKYPVGKDDDSTGTVYTYVQVNYFSSILFTFPGRRKSFVISQGDLNFEDAVRKISHGSIGKFSDRVDMNDKGNNAKFLMR